MNISIQKDLIDYLRDFITESRWQIIVQVLNQRTRHISVVLEDIYQSHNASAVLRSCDCFGIQDVHIIENKHEFDPSKGVTIGADQWLSLSAYKDEHSNNTAKCFDELRNKGYRIVATTPHEHDTTLDKLPIREKTALVFGAELTGLSGFAMKHADGFVRIPMFGFSESYNISVSAALCLYELSLKLREEVAHWQLSEEERIELQLEWLKKSIRAGNQLERKFLKERNSLSKKKITE